MMVHEQVPETESDVRLLLADDNQATLDLLMFKSQELGWTSTQVTSASGIIQAMNDCNTEAGDCYDAIIADINFFDNNVNIGPRMTGITAIREIRKVLPDIPVVFITAYINSITKEEIRRVNAELVPKPFDLDSLYSKVNDMVKWHRASKLKQYAGEERRQTSLNLTGETRRAGDVLIKPSERVMQVLTQLREEAKHI
jgi:CheY-like chemotaxis protein